MPHSIPRANTSCTDETLLRPTPADISSLRAHLVLSAAVGVAALPKQPPSPTEPRPCLAGLMTEMHAVQHSTGSTERIVRWSGHLQSAAGSPRAQGGRASARALDPRQLSSEAAGGERRVPASGSVPCASRRNRWVSGATRKEEGGGHVSRVVVKGGRGTNDEVLSQAEKGPAPAAHQDTSPIY